MQDLEKLAQLNELFGYYESLLTQKQVECFKLYYYEDLSLAEVADELSISRNAVYDQLKKVQDYLYEYEEKLNLCKLANKRKELITLYEKTKDLKYIDELRKLDEL